MPNLDGKRIFAEHRNQFAQIFAVLRCVLERNWELGQHCADLAFRCKRVESFACELFVFLRVAGVRALASRSYRVHLCGDDPGSAVGILNLCAPLFSSGRVSTDHKTKCRFRSSRRTRTDIEAAKPYAFSGRLDRRYPPNLCTRTPQRRKERSWS